MEPGDKLAGVPGGERRVFGRRQGYIFSARWGSGKHAGSARLFRAGRIGFGLPRGGAFLTF